MEWNDLENLARSKVQDFGEEYLKRLDYEVSEILKQGSGDYWIDIYEAGKKFDKNKNGLVLPFLLGITNVDPIKEGIPHNIQYQADFPDIDIDFLPNARDPIKEYISSKYGSDRVCSVGSWLTYKPRLALKDAARALGSPDETMRDDQFLYYLENLLDSIPKEFDEMEREKAEAEYPTFKEFSRKYNDFLTIAYRMVGRIKTQGKHAGGIIIASEPIGDHVPLTYDHKSGQHVSSWTEGFNQQLSKFGFVKFDLLGLRTMQDIHVASKYVLENRGIEIDWTYMHPKEGILGRWRDKNIENGEWNNITMTDEKILELCNTQKVETVFQFETDFAMGILKEVGVKSFWDVVAATSLGRPGPMEQIPAYVQNRDDPHKRWKHGLPDKMIEILDMTHGVVIFQEQLQNIWTNLCALTVPEAEKARKAVAKKKADQLLKLEPRVISGLQKYADENFARDWWEKMTKFGRYAFNLSHAAAYSVISWRCLFLKAYYSSEWWAAVLSHAKPDRRAKYIGLARLENIPFGVININSLKQDFSVKGDKILPGLSIIKGVGARTTEALITDRKYTSLDDFMDAHTDERDGKKYKLVTKSVMARLIKLGAFKDFHENRRALWYYYVYKYASNDKLRKKIVSLLNDTYGWNQEDIEKERQKLIADWRRNQKNPGKDPPKKLLNWKPKKSREYTLEDFETMIKHDYSLDDFLEIEKKFYGFYWHSPMELYVCEGSTIQDAKETGLLECVIKDVKFDKSAKGNDYLKLTVTDGLEESRLMVFSDQIMSAEPGLFADGNGIRAEANWSDKYRSFSCKRGKQILGLVRRDKYEKFNNEDDFDEDDIIDLENDDIASEGVTNVVIEEEEEILVESD